MRKNRALPPKKSLALVAALYGLLPHPEAAARYAVKSEFQLQLGEPLFDSVVGDFGQTLSGNRTLTIPDFSVNQMGVPIQIQGIRAHLDFGFAPPERISKERREWNLKATKLAARIEVDRINASTIIEREENGIIIRIRVDAECRNVALRLPEGLTSVEAKVKAELLGGEIKLSLPEYKGNWQQGAWRVERLNCTGVNGFGDAVGKEALAALSSFQNFDKEIREEVERQFSDWSREASKLLLSGRELPTGRDHLRVFFEPKSARDTNSGIALEGDLTFEFPFVAQGQDIEYRYPLAGAGGTMSANAESELRIPFATIRALMMGEYFAGKLEYALKSNEIPAWAELMNNRWAKWFAWPDLFRFEKSTVFAFQFLPMGPPAFDKEKSAARGTQIQGDLSLPLAVRMFAPHNGKYRPMVEFRTLLKGPSKLKLMKGGKIEFQVEAEDQPITYAWNQRYVNKYNPNTHINVDRIGSSVRSGLGTNGISLAVPTLGVGSTLQLVPQGWRLENNGDLRLNFLPQRIGAKK
jgi:hypothetical protein